MNNQQLLSMAPKIINGSMAQYGNRKCLNKNIKNIKNIIIKNFSKQKIKYIYNFKLFILLKLYMF